MTVSKDDLLRLAKHRDNSLEEINEVVADVYGLNKSERKLVDDDTLRETREP
jgi:hypothetical protein